MVYYEDDCEYAAKEDHMRTRSHHTTHTPHHTPTTQPHGGSSNRMIAVDPPTTRRSNSCDRQKLTRALLSECSASSLVPKWKQSEAPAMGMLKPSDVRPRPHHRQQPQQQHHHHHHLLLPRRHPHPPMSWCTVLNHGLRPVGSMSSPAEESECIRNHEERISTEQTV